jgi:hypothetical protein
MLAPRDQGATLSTLPEGALAGVLAALPGKDARAAASAHLEQFGGAGDAGVALEAYEQRRTTAETLSAMGPAKQALLLGSLPAFAGADLLGGLSTTARAAALAGVRVPAQRQAIVDALPSDAMRADTVLALGVLSDAAAVAAAAAAASRPGSAGGGGGGGDMGGGGGSRESSRSRLAGGLSSFTSGVAGFTSSLSSGLGRGGSKDRLAPSPSGKPGGGEKKSGKKLVPVEASLAETEEVEEVEA